MAIPTPAAFWNWDESSGNAVDAVSGGSTNTFVNVNSTAFVAGKIGNCADFEASSSNRFTIANASQTGLNITGDMSIATWANFESAPSGAFGAMELIGKGFDGNTTRQWRMDIQNISSVPKLQFSASATGSGGAGAIVDFSAWALSTWFHIVCLYDASAGSAQFYINASSVGTATGLPTSIFNGTGITVAGDDGAGGGYLDGKMDMTGVWSGLLTPTDISDLYNAGAGIQYPFASAGPANLKSYNTNLKANIKTMNTNVLANVKTFDTNA